MHIYCIHVNIFKWFTLKFENTDNNWNFNKTNQLKNRQYVSLRSIYDTRVNKWQITSVHKSFIDWDFLCLPYLCVNIQKILNLSFFLYLKECINWHIFFWCLECMFNKIRIKMWKKNVQEMSWITKRKEINKY
jgi:hypothetical protein